MRTSNTLKCILFIFSGFFAQGAGGATAQNPGDFLQGIAGEWTVVSETLLGPDQDPIRAERRESARLVGDRWLVAEVSDTDPMGRPFTSLFTIGYEYEGDRWVGTWIDSLQPHMWVYEGTLDGAGTVLTLDAEGPMMGNREQLGRFRVIIELTGADEKVMRSQIFAPTGEWFEFQRGEYRRVAPGG